jgi:hypothetical protein
MRQPDYDREMRAIRTAVLADRAEFVTCLVLAFTVVALVIVPVAYLLHGMLAHLPTVLAR